MTPQSSNNLIDRATMATHQVADQAAAATQRGVAAVRETSQQVIDRALRASDNTVTYIKEEPVKSMMMAAAAGAALMALLHLATRSRDRA